MWPKTEDGTTPFLCLPTTPLIAFSGIITNKDYNKYAIIANNVGFSVMSILKVYKYKIMNNTNQILCQTVESLFIDTIPK